MAINPPSLACPKSQLWLQKGELEKHWSSLERRVRTHPFNYAVLHTMQTFAALISPAFPPQLEVFLPNCTNLQAALPSAPCPPPYYVSNLPLGHFLEPRLLDRYFSPGKQCPTALSTGRRVDVGRVFSLVPPGESHGSLK